MLNLSALVVSVALSAVPAAPPATPAVEPPGFEAIETAIKPPPSNCSVTCWSTGQTFSTQASTMNQCGAFGDLKCGVCNWDGVFNNILFANC